MDGEDVIRMSVIHSSPRFYSIDESASHESEG